MGNRLKNETSPYLLQHADNPVDWHPWDEEALHLAREQDKPIFLSIGYAACHWCHVMAHETFENRQIAALMNQHFINIKVDREERPDLDAIYMQAVVALSGQGGWPMSVFLTPGGEPFYGGTYFPPTPRFQRPSFEEVLMRIARLWQDDRPQILELAEKLRAHVAAPSLLQTRRRNLDPQVLDAAASRLSMSYDWTDGGWGGAPKFPPAAAIEFLLLRNHRHADSRALEMATHALRKMARGGIYDHLGGGFHRYSVDKTWIVPHFEKMLYDNALLSQVYLHAWQITGEDDFQAVAEETIEFLMGRMRHPEGGFFSSLDADSEGEEGKYYLWKLEEMREAIGSPPLADILMAAFGADQSANFEGAGVLFRAKTDQELAAQFNLSPKEIAARLIQGKQALRARRDLREPPGLDDKILTGWNGLMLISLSEAARAFKSQDFLIAAQRLAAFLLENLIVAGRLRRSWRQGTPRLTAYLEDHAALGEGLLALYQTDFSQRWLDAAIEQSEQIQTRFADPAGGFFDTPDDHEQLIARPKSLQDSPAPSGNTLAVKLLLHLGALTGESRYHDAAEKALAPMQSAAAEHPTAFAGWLGAMDFALGPQLQLALIGDPASDDFQALASIAQRHYLPRLVIAGGPPDRDDGPILLKDRTMQEGKATAYLCQSFTCRLPTNSSRELKQQLEEAR